LPAGSPTTAADGIGFGSDVVLYRSASSRLTLTGDLEVTGNLLASNVSISLSGNNTWTGTNTFNGPLVTGSTLSVGNSGISFTSPGASATRSALALVPGTNVQAYSAILGSIVTATPSNNAFLVGNGSGYSVLAGSSARSALGLGTSSTFDVPGSGDASSSQVVLGSDSRLTNSRAPSGSAGGSLAGSYPNPTLAASGVTAGSYGSGTSVPVVTVNSEGRISSVTNTAITGAPPTGTAAGVLSGSYPNPGLAADAVTLGTNTTGNYVATVAAGTGMSVSGSGSESAAVTISTVQNIATSATPAFAGLTLTGAASGTSLSLSGNQSVGGALSVTGATTLSGTTTGLISGKIITVSGAAAGATDTRTGLSKYDGFRPFVTIQAALNAAASGDTIWVENQNAAYAAITNVPVSCTIYLGSGVSVSSLSMSSATTCTISGPGEIRNASGTGVSLSNASAILNLNCQAYGSSVAANITAGTLNSSSHLDTTTSTMYVHPSSLLLRGLSSSDFHFSPDVPGTTFSPVIGKR